MDRVSSRGLFLNMPYTNLHYFMHHGMTCYRAHGPGPVISDPADVGDVLVVGAVVAHVHPIIPSSILSRKNKTKMGQTFAKLFPIPRNCNSRSDKDCGTCA